MKRRFLGIGVLVLLAVGGFVGLRLWFEEPPGINRANFERLRLKMSRHRVIQILGEPTDQPYEVVHQLPQGFVRCHSYMWRADGLMINVNFDENDCLVEGSFNRRGHDTSPTVTAPASLWDHVRRLLRL